MMAEIPYYIAEFIERLAHSQDPSPSGFAEIAYKIGAELNPVNYYVDTDRESAESIKRYLGNKSNRETAFQAFTSGYMIAKHPFDEIRDMYKKRKIVAESHHDTSVESEEMALIEIVLGSLGLKEIILDSDDNPLTYQITV